MCCPEVQCQLQAEAATEPCSRHAGAERVGGEGVMCRLVSNRGWGCDTYTLLQIIYAFTHCYKSYMYTIFINIMGGVLICIISQQDVAYMQRQWGAGGQRGKAGEGEREGEQESTRKCERETGGVASGVGWEESERERERDRERQVEREGGRERYRERE